MNSQIPACPPASNITDYVCSVAFQPEIVPNMHLFYMTLNHFHSFQKSWAILKYAEDNKKDVEAQSENMLPIKKTTFKKLESGVNYTICVSTQINGHSVAKVSIQTKHDKTEKKFEENFNN